MSMRLENMRSLYQNYDEDIRLLKTQQGQLEYMTTMRYIHGYAHDGCRIIEIGAGTGRYSIALAGEGHDVTAVELVQHNLDILREKSEGISNITSIQGDALDLSRFGNDSFDMTLVFGPMYHLYEAEDLHKAIDEAIRITRPGGIIMFAFLSIYAIIMTNYLYGDLKGGLDENYDITDDTGPEHGNGFGPAKEYVLKHTEDQIFTGFDIVEFENLFTEKPVEHMKTVAADSVLELGERLGLMELGEESFAIYADYHFATCEVRELLGSSSHLLYICRKEDD